MMSLFNIRNLLWRCVRIFTVWVKFINEHTYIFSPPISLLLVFTSTLYSCLTASGSCSRWNSKSYVKIVPLYFSQEKTSARAAGECGIVFFECIKVTLRTNYTLSVREVRITMDSMDNENMWNFFIRVVAHQRGRL